MKAAALIVMCLALTACPTLEPIFEADRQGYRVGMVAHDSWENVARDIAAVVDPDRDTIGQK